jgi:mevalonate pyrophosphate decarboxylase
MTVKLLNQTNYANIYGLIDENGKTIGTKEIILAGRNAGTYYDSWSAHTKRQIKKMFKEA